MSATKERDEPGSRGLPFRRPSAVPRGSLFIEPVECPKSGTRPSPSRFSFQFDPFESMDPALFRKRCGAFLLGFSADAGYLIGPDRLPFEP